MLEDLRKMDTYIADGADYDDWESHFFTMQEACCERYYHWLAEKGVADDYAMTAVYLSVSRRALDLFAGSVSSMEAAIKPTWEYLSRPGRHLPEQ